MTPRDQSILDGVRTRHESARPNPAENPAWAHAEHDIGLLLQYISQHQVMCDELSAKCAQLHERLAASEAKREWQPIATAPKDGTPVLVCNQERGGAWIAYWHPVFASGYRPENPWSSLMLNMRWHETPWVSTVPTHWMPLAPPRHAP